MTIQTANAALLGALTHRRAELEAAVLDRLRDDGAPTETADPRFAETLRGTVPAAFEYCLDAIAQPQDGCPPTVPVSFLVHARVAAKNEIALDVVWRRYFASYILFTDLLFEEAEAAGLSDGNDLRRLSSALAAAFDRLLPPISEEYARQETRASSSELRRGEHIHRLLTGEQLASFELDYELVAQHLAVIADGPGADIALRELANRADRRLLLLNREDGVVWGWLGGGDPLSPMALLRRFPATRPPRVRLAIGEPGFGLDGWRHSHRQARAAWLIAARGPGTCTRYADVALLASVSQDDLLTTSLRDIFLRPLEDQGNRGEELLGTLRAYFDSERSISSAASALGVKRETVTNRLRAAEALLGRSLIACAPEVELALRLREFHQRTDFPFKSPGNDQITRAEQLRH